MNYIRKEKEKVIKELLDSNKIILGQLIDYAYFLSLYGPYKDKMSEEQFAEILEITYGSYLSLKNGGQRAGVLRERIIKNKIDEKEKEQIIKELLESNKVKPGQAINYEYFLVLYAPYNDKMNKQQFAEMLGITYSNYINLKNTQTRTVVLKNRIQEKDISHKENKQEISEDEKIIDELLRSGKVKPGQSIDYTKFLELYELYKNKIEELKFAIMLGMSYNSYKQICGKPTRKARVLKDKQKEISKEEKEEIIEHLLSSNKIKPGQILDYAKFLELYELYKNKMSEQQFAKVLEITEASYNSLKNGGKGARVLKDRQEKVSEEEKEEIIDELLRSGKVKSGQLIDYKNFLVLYEPYKDKMTQQEFAKILGITSYSYNNMKNKKIRTKVEDYRNKGIIDRIKYILKRESRYYSKKEIEEICEEYGVDKTTIIQYIFCAGKEYSNISDYINVLQQKEKIWIGETPCSKEFAESHSKTIIHEAEKISKRKCFKYGNNNYQQDLASDCIVYILKNCGDIDKNFNNNEKLSKELIEARMRMFVKYKCLNSLSKPKEYSYYKKFTYKGDEKEAKVFDRGIEDKTQNVEKQVEDNILRGLKGKAKMNPEEACMELLKINVQAGLNREEAISETGKALGINPKTIIALLKNYMIKQNMVKETKDGAYMLGEK